MIMRLQEIMQDIIKLQCHHHLHQQATNSQLMPLRQVSIGIAIQHAVKTVVKSPSAPSAPNS